MQSIMALARNLSTIGLSIALGILSVSCAETKVSQCQKIIEITQKISQESQETRQTKDFKKILQMADNFEETAQTMEGMAIADEKLTEYKQGFASVYRGYAQVTRDFIDALQNQDPTKARVTQKRVQEIGKQEQALGGNLNSYCQNN
jgi:Na+/phosphate symporter